ncbi:hypothetical protein ACJQWK_06260 [Exserohilum turcicum]|uniref:Aminoglycoside phosphotransferase domain-containing protein n=1 Tax=Exserohilum turcicum (strain 28A) TaxID=671987 RepID=R0K6P4_EXST2|nr:uncharacterized protein SETTUDRAFT_91435 [Exserohilum turcica Et28A]EOA85209.1 hypothetical protein SETTUDRAFT_91435 [Exserohilum turcica Et28A]
MSQGFWGRFGLTRVDEEVCVRALRSRYSGCRVDEFEEQGYCSYTMRIAPASDIDDGSDGHGNSATRSLEETGRDELIVQLRPAPHALDLNITHVAKKTYPSLAPTVAVLDLYLPANLKAYGMDKLAGTPLRWLLPRTCTLTAEAQAKLETLITSFADFIVQGWQSASKVPASPIARATRADSPMEDITDNVLSQCRGKVGSSIIYRLEKLAAELPDAALRERAEKVLSAVQNLIDYPTILNHGDLIPSNILVGENRWEITGVVDWAEAEFLPFGTCLYGLEHLLGYLLPASSDTVPRWVYFRETARLRELFWSRLFAAAPDLKAREHEIRLMRDMGVLLWHGIVWDDGAIDRVVNGLDDQEELAKLRAFLATD